MPISDRQIEAIAIVIVSVIIGMIVHEGLNALAAGAAMAALLSAHTRGGLTP